MIISSNRWRDGIDTYNNLNLVSADEAIFGKPLPDVIPNKLMNVFKFITRCKLSLILDTLLVKCSPFGLFFNIFTVHKVYQK